MTATNNTARTTISPSRTRPSGALMVVTSSDRSAGWVMSPQFEATKATMASPTTNISRERIDMEYLRWRVNESVQYTVLIAGQAVAAWQRLFAQPLQPGKGGGHRSGLRRRCAVRRLPAAPRSFKPVVARPILARRGVTQLHRQADAPAFDVHLHDLDLHDVAGLRDLARVADELVRELAHVHQPILVHAQVHEGAERGHVAHRALQDHAGLQVADVVHPGV